MTLPPLTLEMATALLSLANADVWHLDHASGRLLAAPGTLALWLDAPPGPTQLALTELRPLVHPSDWGALATLWGAAVTDVPQTTTVRLRNRHGAWRWLKLRTQVVTRTPQGQPTHSMGLVTDISAQVRHRIHQQLQQAFAGVMATSPDRDTLAHAMLSAALTMPDLDLGGLYLRDADGGYALIASEGLSPEFLATVGHLAPGSPMAELADAGHLVCSFAAGPQADQPDPFPPQRSGEWAYEPALLQRPGLPVEGIQSLVVVPIRAGGAVRACLNLASTQARRLSDATVATLQTLAAPFGLALEHLAAREEAQHQRENIERFFQTLQEYVCVFDEQGRIQYISHSVRQQLGYGDELLGQPVLVMHPARVHTQAMEVVQAMLAGRLASCPLPILAADGREVMVDTRIVRGHWNGQPALLAVSRDVTELNRLQRELELRAHYQQATLDNFPFLVWLKDQEGRFLAVNQPFAQACGQPDAQSLVGLTDQDIWPADLAHAYQADDQAVLASGQSCQAEERIESQGQRQWSETYKSPVIVNGQLMGTVGYSRDITERKALEQQRTYDHSLMRALINTLPDLFWLKDTNGLYLACNLRFESFFGHTEAEIVGKTDFDFVPRGLAESFRKNDAIAMQKNAPSVNEELLRFASDGHEELVETIKVPVRTPDGAILGVLGLSRDITERKQVEAERAELLGRLQSIAEQVPGIICQYRLRTDGTAHFPYGSGTMLGILGVTPESVRDDDSAAMSLIHPEDQHKVTQSILASARTLTLWREEFRVTVPRYPNDVLWIHAQGFPQRLPDGSTLWHNYLQDITEERHARERLRLGAAVFAHSYNGIMVTDAHQVIIEVNPAFSRITGYGPDEVLGRTPKVLRSGRQGSEFYTAMWASIREQGHWDGEVWNRRKNGEAYAEILSIAAMTDEAGQLTHYIGVFSDITRLKTHEAQLAHIAHYDVLTGLPNRRLLGDRMQVALARARREQLPLAVCMLDLDGFKQVNDVHGHAAGDDLLVEVARRLQKGMREGDTVARLGGDEFVLLLSDLQHPKESHSMLERVLQAIAQPIALGGAMVRVSASVGMTRYPHDDADADTLLRHADQAMYAAKQAGKNRYHLFDPEHDRQIQTHREKLDRLKQAMAIGELVMHYQPKVNLRTGTIIGMEALIRWQHPTEGLLAPAHFLPLAMGHSFEHRLGEWVIDQVLTQISQWQALGLDLVVSANISANHLLHGQFAEHLALALAAHPQASPQRLELEILETAAIGDMESASQVLHRCRALGVRFSLDDFGTGYSSLSYFRSLPVDMIKIDQSFVRDMLEDPNDLGIVDSVLRLAQAFNRPVIAEGVETLMHGSALLMLGCELVQGYGVARPMPADQVPGWMAQWQTPAVWKTLDHPRAVHDLALSVVTCNHRKWMDSVLCMLDEGMDRPAAQPDLYPCSLGRWLTGGGAATYGDSPRYQTVCQLHDQAHGLASRLLASIRIPPALEADSLRLALQTTSTELLEQLEQLIQPQGFSM